MNEISVKMIAILFFALVSLLIYKHAIRTWSFFSDRNVNLVRGYPILGTFTSAMIDRKVMVEEVQRIYNQYPDDRYIGMYELGGKPSVMICDAELVKAVTIKDFDAFTDRIFHIDESLDPLMSRALSLMHDQKWRDMRSVLSPLFTGSKMRMMLSLMTDSIHDFTATIRQEISEKSAKGAAHEFHMMSLLETIANDVIATCVFGVQTNSLKEKDNEFYAAGKGIAAAVESGKILIVSRLPAIAKFFQIKVIEQKYNDFFRNIVRSSIEQRKKHNIARPDMIQLMFAAQQSKLDSKEKDDLDDAGFATVSEEIFVRSTEKLRELTEDDFVAQCLVFFVAGFSAVATTLTFLCHELAMQPDIQQRLRQEIDEMHESLDGKKVTYEALQRMKYLDQVISEIMRLWPAAFMTDRRVTKQYVLENTDGTELTLEPGDIVWLPIYALHRDQKYYPNPERFDPERFSVENRKSIVPGSYLPFGIGPRACIASRFALMELKATIYYMLLNFNLECGENTDVNLELKPCTVCLDAKKGFWLQLKIRN